MGISIKKKVTGILPNPFAEYSSWLEFYTDMTAEMAANNYLSIAKTDLGEASPLLGPLNILTEDDLEQYKFIIQLCFSYDQTIKGGYALSALGGSVGGIKGGNLLAMILTACYLAKSNKLQKNSKDLLEIIGSAVQAYWLGAQFSPLKMPKLPMIGGLQNIPPLINGTVLNPGIWTPLPIFNTQDDPNAWLLNFIASANLHLLTVGGIMSSNVTYPPPAPPAPGILPWIGYFVKPIPPVPPLPFSFKLIKNPTLTQKILAIGKETIKKVIIPVIKQSIKTAAFGGQKILLANTAATTLYVADKKITLNEEVDKIIDSRINKLPIPIEDQDKQNLKKDIKKEVSNETGIVFD